MKRISFFVIIIMTAFSLNAQNNSFHREANTHRIMSYNIHNAQGTDGKTDYKRIANHIESISPDVIALQEVDSITRRSNNTDVLKTIADITRMHYIYSPAIFFEGGKYGIGLLSKERPISHKKIALPGAEEARTLLMAEYSNYIVFATHLSLTASDREQSVTIINEQAKLFNKPVFLAGDLNATPESDEIKSLAKDWKILNNVKAPTYPSAGAKETIDYLMGYTANGKTYSVLQVRVIPDSIASDHRPIFADIRLKADNDKVMRTQPYLQNPSPDGMTIMWLTNVPCRSWVEYGTDSTNMKRARTFIEGEMMANNTINRIRLEGLQPGTKYYYRAVSQEITLYQPYKKEFGDTIRTAISSFTTWDDNKKDFTAIIFNDLHDNYKFFDKLAAQIKDVEYDVVIFNGDCIADVQTEENAVKSISHYSNALGGNNIPTIFIRGNHETRGAYSMFLWNLLEKKGGAHTYGGFNLGDTRFVLLDCGEDKPDDHWVYYDMNDFTHYRQDQAEFLKKEIVSNEFRNAKKRILIHHIPIYGRNMDSYNPCKDLWENILSKAPFDVSLNAHTHRFEYIPKGQDGNNYPVLIGGGPSERNSGVVTIIRKQNDKMTLDAINAQGENILHLDL